MSYFSTLELKAERRARNKQRRKEEKSSRAERRSGNTLLYRGPMAVGSEIVALMSADAREVKAQMSGHRLRRATKVCALHLCDIPRSADILTREANVVFLADSRAEIDTGWVLGELIDTSDDIRLHLSRLRELRGSDGAPVLSIMPRKASAGQ